jgi:hypothetical protein
MRIEKPEKLVGYVLLVIGIIIVLIPVLVGIQILLGNMGIPQYVAKPFVNPNDSAAEVARVMAEAFPLLNVVPTFLLMVILVYAGSVLMGKGIGLVKEIEWKVVRPTRRSRAEKEEEPE